MSLLARETEIINKAAVRQGELIMAYAQAQADGLSTDAISEPLDLLIHLTEAYRAEKAQTVVNQDNIQSLLEQMLQAGNLDDVPNITTAWLTQGGDNSILRRLHNALQGLQGGSLALDEYYHLTYAELTNLRNLVDNGGAGVTVNDTEDVRDITFTGGAEVSFPTPNEVVVNVPGLAEDIMLSTLRARGVASEIIKGRKYKVINALGGTAAILVEGDTATTITGEAFNVTTQTKGTYVLSTDSFTGISGGGGATWGAIGGTLSSQTDLQNALNAKQATITATTTADYYRGDKTFATLNKAAVGLGNVDNTADTSKPVSTLQQAALDGKQASNTSLSQIAAATYADDDFVQKKAGALTNRTIAQVLTDLASGILNIVIGTVTPAVGPVADTDTIKDVLNKVARLWGTAIPTKLDRHLMAHLVTYCFKTGALVTRDSYIYAKPTVYLVRSAGCSSVSFQLINTANTTTIGAAVSWDGTPGNAATAVGDLNSRITAASLPFDIQTTVVLSGTNGAIENLFFLPDLP